MFSQQKKNDSYFSAYIYIAIAISIVVILITRLMHLEHLKHVVVIQDEVMYWAHAANFMKYNWTEITRSWYSYGYSILLLPFFMITKSFESMYQMAIVMNACMGIVSFFMVFLIFKELFAEKLNALFGVIIACLVACYSSYQLQSQIAWSETTLYTVFLVLIYVFILYAKKPSLLKCAIVTLLTGYIYLIHNRNLGTVMALYMVLLVMLLLKQIDIKHLILSLAIMVAIFVADRYIRAYLTDIMWGHVVRSTAKTTAKSVSKATKSVIAATTSALSAAKASSPSVKTSSATFYGNDVKSILHNMQLLSMEFWWSFISSLVLKIWSNITSTFLISLWGVIYLFKEVIESIKKKNWTSKSNVCLFVLIATIIMFTVVAVFLKNPKPDSSEVISRVDFYLYTRYTDVLTGILIVFGIVGMLETITEKHFYKTLILVSIIYIVCFLIGYIYFSYIEKGNLNVINTPSILFFPTFDMRIYTIFVLAVHLAICIVAMICKKYKQVVLFVLFFGVSIVFYSISANTAYASYVQVAQKDQKKFDNVIEFFEKYSEYPIVIFNELVNCPTEARVRTSLVDRKIVHDKAELDKNETNYFTITTNTKVKAKDYPDKTLFIWDFTSCSVGACGEELQQKLKDTKEYHLDPEKTIGSFDEVQISTIKNASSQGNICQISKDGKAYFHTGELEKGVYKIEFFAEGKDLSKTKASLTYDLGAELIQDIKIVEGYNVVKFPVLKEHFSIDMIVENASDEPIVISRMINKTMELGWGEANKFNNAILDKAKDEGRK